MKHFEKKTPSSRKKSPTDKSAKSAASAKLSRTHKPEDMTLEQWQLALRKQFGEQQEFVLENRGSHPIFSEFSLLNPKSAKTYRIAIRGTAPGSNYCSCPDYRINTLGSCKHIEFVLARLALRRGGKAALRKGYLPPYSEVYLSYGVKREVRFRAGAGAMPPLTALAGKFFDAGGVLKERKVLDFSTFLAGLPDEEDHEVRCYDDVMAFIAEYQDAAHRLAIVEARLGEGIASPIFDTVLKTALYPYQREGALFALRAGRCLLGDDMGLGKTIQALAAAELMAELYGVERVLIVSPTSLKYQWQTEIEKFTDRTAQVIEGLNHQRRQLYKAPSFYKLVNYELVARDSDAIREWAPDLIILDEAQRIKNWKTRTAQSVKSLESSFAIVLTGTPIENRIEELHSIVEFVDHNHLGPLYRFVNKHRVVDEGGKLVGYQRLDEVRDSLKGVMLRRRKEQVLKQLPPRIDKNFLVPMTPEQQAIHDENGEIVAKLVAKWRRHKFLCDADQKRMQCALAYMRMSADNTYLVDRATVNGPKLDELEALLKELVVEGGEKVVVFSQWLRMTELVEKLLLSIGIGFVHLNGGVPSKSRKALMTRFKEDPTCMVFLSTDAGGVGLNLQSGSVVINMDIPWNPAVLEQRIGRVHRMGQGKTVRVVNFVSRSSIEERILDLLRFKSSLASGALDEDGSDSVTIGASGMEKYMNAVEQVVDALERPDPGQEKLKRIEVALDEQKAENEATSAAGVGASTPDNSGAEALNTLLTGGAQFLMNLSRALSQPAAPDRSDGKKTHEQGVNSLIGRDEATGGTYLKIPLPQPDVLNQVISGLGALLAGLAKR